MTARTKYSTLSLLLSNICMKKGAYIPHGDLYNAKNTKRNK